MFFLCVLTVVRAPLSWTIKKNFLLLASYLMYAGWNPPFVILLWISTFVDWHAANWIAKSEDRTTRRVALVSSLIVNLGFLCYFKYGNFIAENALYLIGYRGEYQPAPIYLPVGISFYTFQTLSYTIDVYRKRLEPAKSPLDFALYVSFFPQLVAGPIVRATDFLPQCLKEVRASLSQLSWGLLLLILGCFQKVVLADAILAPIAESVFDNPGTPDCISAWAGTLAFAGQIFFDFSGYSTCAIGVAMALGFRIPDNFRFPYAARGFSDFWRRWHISLSSWLRDYLYIPLGGNRHGPTRTQVNLTITMLLGGLWHGASWTFVVWGALHGLLLVAEKSIRAMPFCQWSFWNRLPGQLVVATMTFLAICFTWVFFRASSFAKALDVSLAMLGGAASSSTRMVSKANLGGTLAVVGGLLVTHFMLRNSTLESAVQSLESVVESCASPGHRIGHGHHAHSDCVYSRPRKRVHLFPVLI